MNPALPVAKPDRPSRCLSTSFYVAPVSVAQPFQSLCKALVLVFASTTGCFLLLRAAGQRIDIRNQCVQILRKVSFLSAVNETSLEILNSNRKQMALLGVSPSGQRQPTLTAEYEMVRGDVVKVLYNVSQNANSKQE